MSGRCYTITLPDGSQAIVRTGKRGWKGRKWHSVARFSQEEIDEADAEEEEATESSIGRRIRTSEVKRKRGRPRKDGT